MSDSADGREADSRESVASARRNAAARLRALHVPGQPLFLPNVWDAAGALAVQKAGFPVVATSSVAVAESLGYADGATPVAEMLAAAARIGRVCEVPMTVDAESGYGLAPGDLTLALSGAGAAGCNLEDSSPGHGPLLAIEEQAAFLAQVRASAPDLVINARIDVFLRQPDPLMAIDEAIERARAYIAAGADCVYPILLRDPECLRRLVAAAPAVNATLLPDGPDRRELSQLGVARISMAGALWRRAGSWLAEQLAALGPV